MVSEAPPFWWERPGLRSGLLAPFGWVYGRVARRIMERRVRRSMPVPVICVGNFTVGGSGKTPTALALADAAIARGLVPGFLSRGYGGAVRHATRVDPAHDSAKLVGDEPMLLAARAMTVVGPDRVAGAELLIREGAEIIIMDDGFQSARLVFDHAMMVVDARRGIGNGRVFPAGPVRAPVIDQVRLSDSLLVIGRGNGGDRLIRMAARAAKPVHIARLEPDFAARLRGFNCLAFAAIGDPEKFFITLEEAGIRVARRYGFPDHHHFTDEEVASLMDEAALYGLTLVTTSKDAVRLEGGHGRSRDLAAAVEVLEVKLEFDQPGVPGAIITSAIEAFRRRAASPRD
ncbi:lipid-A-disaccharide kinase [Hoeflea marina]|uniref:Tetraacyldisaccharide 4'-kinase n=1 Tax=Hoeflea marina TaxID=274592 RepID=A0A317PNQ4_9HYPH|nr:tetraacyldisaccharide 4'-kinase [Hoeflea marina]PWW01618.1 lipid-A-disaccharide kinase [Hoeflea marina]